MIKKFAITTEMKSDVTFDKRPEDVPANYLIFTAPRPLPGVKTWRGSKGYGWHFAAIDPKDSEMAPIYLKSLKQNAATLLRYVTEKEYREWLPTYFEEKEELNLVLKDPELFEYYKDRFVEENSNKVAFVML